MILPYAAKALVEHRWEPSRLDIWLTFALPMNQNVMPDLSLWHVYLDSVLTSISSVSWLDMFTLKISIESVETEPMEVEVSYLGPEAVGYDPHDPTRKNLETTWGKNWEGWGKILSIDISS
jgi:hypothetical protein